MATDASPRHSLLTQWAHRRDHRAHAGTPSNAASTSSTLAWPILLSILTLVLLLNVGMGAVEVSPRQILTIFGDHIASLAARSPMSGPLLGIGKSLLIIPGVSALRDMIQVDTSLQQDSVVWLIRLPRALMATIIGAGLATSGAAMQGMFRNPLADPGLIGVSSGAALGAVIAIVLDVTSLGSWTIPVMAVIGGGVVTTIVYFIARHDGRSEVVTLLLAGVAVNAIAGAGISFLLSIASDRQLRSVTFWTLGSLGGSRWVQVAVVGSVTLVCTLIIQRFATQLNLIALGERESRHLGVNVEQVRVTLIIATAAMTGTAVAFSGTIGFVGLIVPHLIRLWQGPDHRRLLPMATVTGAILLLSADLASRTLVAPTEFPLGVTMSIIGGPFFLWLLLRVRSQQGGWG